MLETILLKISEHPFWAFFYMLTITIVALFELGLLYVWNIKKIR